MNTKEAIEVLEKLPETERVRPHELMAIYHAIEVMKQALADKSDYEGAPNASAVNGEDRSKQPLPVPQDTNGGTTMTTDTDSALEALEELYTIKTDPDFYHLAPDVLEIYEILRAALKDREELIKEIEALKKPEFEVICDGMIIKFNIMEYNAAIDAVLRKMRGEPK